MGTLLTAIMPLLMNFLTNSIGAVANPQLNEAETIAAIEAETEALVKELAAEFKRNTGREVALAEAEARRDATDRAILDR